MNRQHDEASSGARSPSWAERLVRLLDDGFRLPGTRLRFGVDALLGFLLPGVGDALTGTGSIAILALALRRGVPTVVLVRMLLNILVDAGVGAIPVLGDAFDVWFKSNRRNLVLLERASPDVPSAAELPAAKSRASTRSLSRARRTRPLDYVLVVFVALVVLSLALLPWVLVGWMTTEATDPGHM